MRKQISHILAGRAKSIGEETVLQPLPHKDFRFANPFILIHHLPTHVYEPGSPPERIHPHPHRGFAPVTFMFQGEGYHKDSEGNSGVLRAGEVQWMFAGRGLLHSEGPTKQLLESGGSYEFVQVWVNVPGKHKMDEPFYVQATKDKMPMLFNEGGIDLRLASGQYKDLTGPIQSFTPVVAVFGSVKANKYFQLKADEGYWTLLYVLDGSILVDNTEITGPQLVVFDPNGTEIDITSTSLAQLLYLSAAPIDEPVAARGNFVMNTAEELTRAEEEYAAGKFGAIDY